MHSPTARGYPMIVALAVVLLSVPAMAQERTAQQKRVDRAIVNALRHLAMEQQPSGAWRVDQYGESTATTSLAVMAFLAAGHLPNEGPYGERISRGIKWVIDHQQAGGMLVHRQSHGPMYSHGISTLMLAEVVGMVGKREAKPVRMALENAVSLIIKAQNRPKARNHEGGWRYSASSADSDLSVTGWQLLALRAAKNVGCDVPKSNIDRAIAYVKRCSSGGGFTYQPGQRPTTVRTGTGILALEAAGDYEEVDGKRKHSAASISGADYILRRPLHWDDNHFFYGVYYCSVGMFKMGGTYWERTQPQIENLLLSTQQVNGAWLGPKERRYGRAYCTSMAVLALAIDYRYLPIYQR